MRDYEIRSKCTDCGKTISLKVNKKDFEKWQRGTLVQDAFPYLTVCEREILVSRMCGKRISIRFYYGLGRTISWRMRT